MASSSSMRHLCAETSASSSDVICCDMPLPMHLKGDPEPLNGDFDFSPVLGVEGRLILSLRSSTFTRSTIDSNALSWSQKNHTRRKFRSCSFIVTISTLSNHNRRSVECSRSGRLEPLNYLLPDTSEIILTVNC